MSPRPSYRRFAQATVSRPGTWLVASGSSTRASCSNVTLSIEEVAGACGFAEAATLRHHFRRHLGVSPACIAPLRRRHPSSVSCGGLAPSAIPQEFLTRFGARSLSL